MTITNLPPVKRDLSIVTATSLVISQVMISIGAGLSWFELISSPNYLPDTLFVFVLAASLWWYVRWMTGVLQAKYDWMAHTFKRVALQTLLALMIPSIACVVATALYFYLHYKVPVATTTFPDYEFPFSVIIIAQFNLYYIIYYFYQKSKSPQQTIGLKAAQPMRTLIGSRGKKSIPIEAGDIAFVVIRDSVVSATLFDGSRLPVGYTLDELQSLLDEDFFFRANRQVIISRKSCRSFVSEPNGKLLIESVPSMDEPVVVSQLKAVEFKKWIAK